MVPWGGFREQLSKLQLFSGREISALCSVRSAVFSSSNNQETPQWWVNKWQLSSSVCFPWPLCWPEVCRTICCRKNGESPYAYSDHQCAQWFQSEWNGWVLRINQLVEAISARNVMLYDSGLNLLVRTVRKPVEMHRNSLCSSHKADQVIVFSSVTVIVISCASTTKSTFWTPLC